jgi:hypothetical protein
MALRSAVHQVQDANVEGGTRMKRQLALGATSGLLVLAAGCSTASHNSGGQGGGSSLPSVTATPGGNSGGRSGGHSTSTTSATAPSGNSTSTTQFGTTKVKGTTALSQEGVGSLTTRLFTISSGSSWDVAWSYDCPGSISNSGGIPTSNFFYQVYKGGTKDAKDAGAGGVAASNQGTSNFSDSGTFSIHIGAQPSCAWSVKAIILPSS